LTSRALLLFHPFDYDQLKDQFLSHIPDAEFIKKCFSNLCSYLQIPYGEGQGLRYQLNLKEFSIRYELNTKKSFETFKLLAREGVFELVKVYQKKTKVQIICGQNQALDIINQGGKTAVIIQYLMRTYDNIFNNKRWVKLDEISKKIALSQSEILKIFNNLFENKNIDLQIYNTDLELFWTVPREDQYTLNPFLNNIAEYNRLKVKKVQTMIHYVSETKKCKRNMILNYFGEEKLTKCKQCSSESCRTKEMFPKELYQ
jgi:ATP-dependent DNA helicase RecQ